MSVTSEVASVAAADMTRVTGMDLKQQLVIWKRADFLLNNVSLSQNFCNALVEHGLFNNEMMKQVHAQKYNVEQTLKMLTLLGTKGDNAFWKFISILEETEHVKAVRELRRTEKYTRFGEMLPPCFTYFMNMSEFLRYHPHISLKLGEDEKYILQTFIEGKVSIEARKHEEKVRLLEEERDRLKERVSNMEETISDLSEHKRRLEATMEKATERIKDMKSRVKELEAMNADCRSEVRRYRHYRQEQEELEQYIAREGEPYNITPAGEASYAPEALNFENGKAPALKLRLLLAQVNLAVNTLYYVQANVKHLESEEMRIKGIINKEDVDQETLKDLKKLLNESRKERKELMVQIREGEEDVAAKEVEINDLRSNVLQIPRTPLSKSEPHDGLSHKLGVLLEQIRLENKKKLTNAYAYHEKEVAKLMKHIQDINMKHMEEVTHLKGRIRGKMNEVHRREMLLRRLRHQMNVLTRFHAKNMNATQSIEDCRKVVRQIIGEARKLRAMADLETPDKDKGQEEGGEGSEQQKKQEEERKKQAAAQAALSSPNSRGKKKRKKKKKYVGLSDERLMYVADNIAEWRLLGKALGVTNNHMDMVEMDTIDSSFDKLGFNMLRVWRDELNGKVVELFDALVELERKDLAMIILPEGRMEVTKNQPTDDEGTDTELASQSDVNFMMDETDNFKANVPVLPQIAAA